MIEGCSADLTMEHSVVLSILYFENISQYPIDHTSLSVLKAYSSQVLKHTAH